MMPALSVSESDLYFSRPYLRLMDTQGVAYVHIDNSADKFLEKTTSAIVNTWPLFILLLLLTVEGGVFIWLLVRQKFKLLYGILSFLCYLASLSA